MKLKHTSKQKKSIQKNPTNYYQVISKSNKFNHGAFPPTAEGRRMANRWAEKISEETGEKCIVKKR